MLTQQSQNNSNKSQFQALFKYYWNPLSFGFKFLLLTTLIVWVASLFLPQTQLILVSNPYFTIFKWQFWRLFFPFIVQINFLNLVIDFLWLYSLVHRMQKQYSTIYFLVEILLQNMLLQIIFHISFCAFYLFGWLDSDQEFIGFGMFSIVLILYWEVVSQDPQKLTNFCFIPFLMQQKYIPWIVLLFMVLMGNSNFYSFYYYLLAFILGYLQFIFLRRNVFILAFSTLAKVEKILPLFIVNRDDFTLISSVQDSLKKKHFRKDVKNAQEQNGKVENFIMNTFIHQNIQFSLGNGIKIGASQKEYCPDYKNYWANKENSLNPQQSSNNSIFNSQTQSEQIIIKSTTNDNNSLNNRLSQFSQDNNSDEQDKLFHPNK